MIFSEEELREKENMNECIIHPIQYELFGLFKNEKDENSEDFWVERIFGFAYENSVNYSEKNIMSFFVWAYPITKGGDECSQLETNKDSTAILYGTKEECYDRLNKLRHEAGLKELKY